MSVRRQRSRTFVNVTGNVTGICQCANITGHGVRTVSSKHVDFSAGRGHEAHPRQGRGRGTPIEELLPDHGSGVQTPEITEGLGQDACTTDSV